MNHVADVTITATVPENELADTLINATAALTVAGQDSPKVVVRIRSTEFRRLGLELELNYSLTPFVDTVDGLCAMTQTQLLHVLSQIPDWDGYEAMRTIILKLAIMKPPRHLVGHNVPPRDLIERLQLTVYAYTKLKQAGLDRISDLTNRDVVAIEQIGQSTTLELLEVMKTAGFSPTPLDPGRTVGELTHRPVILDFLEGTGYSTDTLVSELTVAQIAQRLTTETGATPEAVASRVRDIMEGLRWYRFQLS